MKTKVVEFINRIQEGGAEALIRDYALLIDKNKFDVVVLCYFASKDSSINKILKGHNIEVVEMYGRFPTVCRVLSRLFNKFNSLLLKKYIKKIKPDVLHAHLEILETLYCAKDTLNDTKLLYTCHNLPKTLIGEDLPREEKAAKYLIENNKLQMIALHDDMAKEINERFNINNTVVIKNGIDFNKFINVDKTKEFIREELSIPKDAYVIGNVGRWSYQKNPEFTLKVFNEISKQNAKAFLLMVGHGNLKNQIKNFIIENKLSNKVMLLSHRDDISELFKAMDVFLFPSRYEGLGIVLIEAQVSNLKCVCSDKIPNEAFQSDLITKLSLNDPIDNWVEACLNPICNIDKYGNIESYDLNKEIIKLEKLYTISD